MYRILIAAVVALLIFTSCSEEGENDNNDLRCNGQEFTCQGEWLQICGANERYAYESCDDICAQFEQIFSGECNLDEERGHDFCVCVDECCEQDTTQCAGAKLEFCENCNWVSVDCDEVCGANGQGSIGCGLGSDGLTAECICTGEATDGDSETEPLTGFCATDGLTKCEESIISACDGGGVNTVSCRDKCEELEYYYDYCELNLDDGKEVCHCTAKEESETCRESEPVCVGDFISSCVDGEVVRQNCLILCDDAGMDYDSCVTDSDRGHDVCLCTEREED